MRAPIVLVREHFEEPSAREAIDSEGMVVQRKGKRVSFPVK